MEHEVDVEVVGDHLSWSAIAQRVVIGIAGAVVFGAGSVMLADNRELAVHNERIDKLERIYDRIPEIDKNVVSLSGKMDVINQKLDDTRDATNAIVRRK